MEEKTPSESAVVMRELVMPNHTNPQNTIFGGVVMSWIDLAAAMAAEKHARKAVVTAHIDSITFEAAIKVGDHVSIMASVNYVGNTSMEVGVKVIAENPRTGENRLATTAHLTFVALDDIGRPTRVPRLKPETEEEQSRFDNAKKRIEIRKQNSSGN